MTAAKSAMGPGPDTDAGASAAPENVTVIADLRSHLRKSKAGISGIVICVLFALVAVVGPWLPFLPDPAKQSLPES